MSKKQEVVKKSGRPPVKLQVQIANLFTEVQADQIELDKLKTRLALRELIGYSLKYASGLHIQPVSSIGKQPYIGERSYGTVFRELGRGFRKKHEALYHWFDLDPNDIDRPVKPQIKLNFCRTASYFLEAQFYFKNSFKNMAYSQGCSFLSRDLIILILPFLPRVTFDITYSIFFLRKSQSQVF